MPGDVVRLYRSEACPADVQSDEGGLDAERLDGFEDLGGNVEPCRRGGDAAGDARVDGLVTFRVCEPLVDVWREGHDADFVEAFFAGQPDEAGAVVQDADDFSVDGCRACAEDEGCAGAHPAAWAYERLPDAWGVAPQEQELDLGAGVLACTVHAGGEYAAIVEDEDVAWAEVVWQVGKSSVFLSSFAAVEDHEAGVVARFCGSLRDEVLGKVVAVGVDVEVVWHFGGIRSR